MVNLMTRLTRPLFYQTKMNSIAGYIFLEENIWDRHKVPKNLPNGTGKTLVITGGNKGIGFEAIKTMLPLGYHIIIGCRSPSALQNQMSMVEQKKPGVFGNGTYEILPLDLTSLDKVQSFAKDIRRKDIPIHGLANNAGKIFGPHELTENGFESQFGVNYLGHVLLTHYLLPQLEAGGSAQNASRITHTSSIAHGCVDYIDYDDLNLKKYYHPFAGYAHSKAAQIMFTKYLDRKLQAEGKPIRVHSFHPGIVRTELYDAHARWVTALYGMLMKSAKQGGDTLAYALLSPELEGKGGTYMRNSALRPTHSIVSNVDNQKKLWDKTMEMLKIKDFGKA